MSIVSKRYLGSIILALAVAVPSIAQEAHVGNLTGHAANGKKLYRRYCLGCHGPLGDGNGDNAQWIDPKPRDFVGATFKCRSTPTGTLPTDQDLYNAISRGFTNSNMPHWDALPAQNRIDLVAYIKTFSPRWQSEKAGEPIKVPPSQRSLSRASRMAANCSRRWSAGSVMASRGAATDLLLRP